jgi:siroheme synthase (precorrin-2 oxidase/ferrochelatase)
MEQRGGNGQRRPGLPVELRLDGRRVLIIGDGAHAERRRARVEPCGAAVRLVGEAEWRPADLEGAHVVLYCGDEAGTAARLRALCDGRGAIFWAHDRPAVSDITMVAIHEAGPVRVSISTGGRAAGLSAALRRALGAVLDSRFAAYATDVAAGRRPIGALRIEGRAEWAEPPE